MNLVITNLDLFKTFLHSITKFVPSCEFMIDTDGTDVLAVSEGRVSRGFFRTNVLKLEEKPETPVSFAFNDVSKLQKSIAVVAASVEGNKAVLDFDGVFLSCLGDSSFKLKVVKRDIIEKYITTPLKTELVDIYSFKTNSDTIRKVIQANNIIMNADNKIYFSVKNNKIIAEIDNKISVYSDSIGVPISTEVTGASKLSKNTCIRFQDFAYFNVLDCENIKIAFTDKNVFIVESRLESGSNAWITAKLVIPILKS